MSRVQASRSRAVSINVGVKAPSPALVEQLNRSRAAITDHRTDRAIHEQGAAC